MSFDTIGYLQRATGRAKSDVANKLISMFLHEVSKKVCNRLGSTVGHPDYAKAVERVFKSNCCYCGQPLEHDRAAVEHPDGMNRFRIGLHIPGNVLVACTRCNREKRRDDSAPNLILSETGWGSFLSHHSFHCDPTCKSCSYWTRLWPEQGERRDKLESARERIG